MVDRTSIAIRLHFLYTPNQLNQFKLGSKCKNGNYKLQNLQKNKLMVLITITISMYKFAKVYYIDIIIKLIVIFIIMFI